MGAVGTSADNALVESFNASLKRETLQGAHAWPDPARCRRAVFGWVNRYNTHRRHSYCGQQAPIVYEQQLESFPATEASHQRQLHQLVQSGGEIRSAAMISQAPTGSLELHLSLPVG
jgi:Integrase core domain